MDMKCFDPGCLLKTARRNLAFILELELEGGVPLNYVDEEGRYVFRYRDGTVLPASLERSFDENWDEHRRIMGAAWNGTP